MERLQAFKYELMPTGEQQRQLRQFSGACRFVFNKALALQQANHAAEQPFIRYVALAKQLTAWRQSAETAWLRDAPCHPLQHALKDLDRAYSHFFAKRAGFPRFKKKGQSDSFRYPDPKQIKLDQPNDRIFLPKLGWLRFRNSREVRGAVRNVTVSLRGGMWFISIQTRREVTPPIHPSTTAIGIDVGIARFATLSDGSFYAPLSSFKRQENALAKAQRQMSRKVKFSNNWKQAKARVQRLHTGIANARQDYLHKITTTISQNHALVCVEDLQINNLSASAAGTLDAPGKQVRAKTGLNKAILDQGWGEFRRQLDYKLAWQGGQLLAVPPRNTSRTCPVCRTISKDNRLTQASFRCVACDYENNADVVGAINILRAGHARLAGEVNGAVSPSAAGTYRSDREAA